MKTKSRTDLFLSGGPNLHLLPYRALSLNRKLPSLKGPPKQTPVSHTLTLASLPYLELVLPSSPAQISPHQESLAVLRTSATSTSLSAGQTSRGPKPQLSSRRHGQILTIHSVHLLRLERTNRALITQTLRPDPRHHDLML